MARLSKGRAPSNIGIAKGFRSGLEDKVADYLTDRGVGFDYEAHPLPYVKPARTHKYTPDFFLKNGVIIETKGRFVTADRQKMVLIRKQHPNLDIRFVFSRSKTPINKGSKTTYAMWCEKNGFPYADKLPPEEWLNEPPNSEALEALKDIINNA